MKQILIIFLSIFLGACTGKIEVSKPIPKDLITGGENSGYSAISVWGAKSGASGGFINKLSRDLSQHLADRSLLHKETGTLKVVIELTAFKVDTSAARAVFGALAGANEVSSTIEVINTKTKEVVGKSNVSTSDSLGGMEGLSWLHADDIAIFLSAEE